MQILLFPLLAFALLAFVAYFLLRIRNKTVRISVSIAVSLAIVLALCWWAINAIGRIGGC